MDELNILTIKIKKNMVKTKVYANVENKQTQSYIVHSSFDN